LINNRQGGRRRGRGGQRGPNLGGNRQDNRQRGNAAQLLEKYKNMARDAQLAGDRVQAEYYLQFADHYFRVLGENRARFDEQRRQRGDDGSDDDENEDNEDSVEASDDDREDDRPRQRANGGDRPRRNDRGDRGDRNARNGARHVDSGEGDEHRIPMAALPPAIGRDDDEGEAPAKPKRRARKPRGEGDEAEIAPAA
jgi:hypothetical protein